MIKWTAAALILGFLIDLLLGDPRWLYHPVRIIGNSISLLEKWLRKVFPATKQGEQKAGLVLVMLICAGSGLIPLLLLCAAYKIHVVLGFLAETFFCYQLLATKSLRDESMRVYRELKKKDLPKARYAVSMIVGRDTAELTEEGVTKATVETIAENTSDGIIAPLFYMAVGGPALMFLYKGINTMDSMVGYKNEKYLLTFLAMTQHNRFNSSEPVTAISMSASSMPASDKTLTLEPFPASPMTSMVSESCWIFSGFVSTTTRSCCS